MKYVFISLQESSKIDFSGAEKLAKTDHLVFLYVKGKKTLPASVKEALTEVKAEIEYVEIANTSELIPVLSYLIGFHEASKHDVIVITEDKSKLPSKVVKGAKVYSAFRSVTGAASASTAKKTTSAKKSTSSKTSSTSKKTSASKKSTTAKKSTTKKSTAKKKDDVLDVTDILNTIVKKMF
ncbi:MAG: hypothetical protein J6Y58_11020 [Clostridiales bacterium]|nr:hypothetical protein [Clostridiales bacterium]